MNTFYPADEIPTDRVPLSMGDRVVATNSYGNKTVYLVAQVEMFLFSLINVKSGNRFTEPESLKTLCDRMSDPKDSSYGFDEQTWEKVS